MRYIIKTMSKTEVFITEEEYQRLISSKATGLVFIESIKGTVNLNSVEFILPENLVKRDLTIGRLHDGTKVVKRFGEWKDASDPEIHLNPSYYPEILKDEIMSEEEYQNKQKLIG